MKKYDPKYTQCPICQLDDIQIYHHDFRGNTICRCNSCFIQFMNPVYSDKYLTQFYAEYYTGAPSTSENAVLSERTNNIKFRAIEKFIKAPGRLLDFGCGNGNFMQTAQKRGWQVKGYDVDCDVMQHVAKRLNVEVGCGNLHEIDWPKETFDLIHAHHVVEHLKRPVADVKKLNEWLKPGGYFYVATPNIDAYSARLKFHLEKRGLRKKNVGKYYDSEHHVFYYSYKSMRNLLRSCGFEVLMTMNGNKLEISDSPFIQFFSYYLTNYLYQSSAFFMIARKVREA